MSIKSQIVCNDCGAELAADAPDAIGWIIIKCTGAIGIGGQAMHLCIDKCAPAFAQRYPQSGLADQIAAWHARRDEEIFHETAIEIATDGKVHRDMRSVIATVRSQFPWFRPTGVSIEGDSKRWVINDFKIGMRSQFSQSGSVPGDAFTARCMPNLGLERVPPAVDILLDVRYIGPEPEGERFVGKIVGLAGGPEIPDRPESTAVASAVKTNGSVIDQLDGDAKVVAESIRTFLLGDPMDKERRTPWNGFLRGFAIELVHVPPDGKWQPIGEKADFRAAYRTDELAYNITLVARAHAKSAWEAGRLDPEVPARFVFKLIDRSRHPDTLGAVFAHDFSIAPSRS